MSGSIRQQFDSAFQVSKGLKELTGKLLYIEKQTVTDLPKKLKSIQLCLLFTLSKVQMNIPDDVRNPNVARPYRTANSKHV
jgi:hypothetical protein